MATHTDEAHWQTLDPRARSYWYVVEGITSLVIVLIAATIVTVIERFTSFSFWWWLVPVVLVVGAQLLWNVFRPAIEFRQWRYAIRDDEVDMVHGILVRTRQVVPMSRIQHVDTERNPFQRHYGLATVKFYTAAGHMEIPQLATERADAVRDQIAALAKVHDDL